MIIGVLRVLKVIFSSIYGSFESKLPKNGFLSHFWSKKSKKAIF